MNQTNTNNVNKTRDLLQTTGGKDEPNKHKQRIVIKSVQQCRYFLFFVNLLLVGVNYGQRTMQVCS